MEIKTVTQAQDDSVMLKNIEQGQCFRFLEGEHNSDRILMRMYSPDNYYSAVDVHTGSTWSELSGTKKVVPVEAYVTVIEK